MGSPSLWVKIFKPQRVCVWVCCCVQHFGWVPPGLTCCLQCILLGLLWAPQFFQWVPLAVLWAPRLCLTICGGLHMGSYWAPVFLQVCAMGSVWVATGPGNCVSTFLVGSAWALLGFPCVFAALCSGFILGSCWALRLRVAICSGLALGSSWAPINLAIICSGVSYGLLLGS